VALSLEQNFAARFKPGSPDECWLWQGYRQPSGYGHLYGIDPDTGRQKAMMATRYAYLLHKGAIPDGHVICHTCDNPPCVNPAHLWAGTNKANSQDCILKGRARGNSNADYCRSGHLRTPDNTAIVSNRRLCKICNRASSNRFNQKKA
jgi:hypothetical protein